MGLGMIIFYIYQYLNLPFARPLPLAQCVKAALLYLRIWNLLNNLRLEKPCSKISDQCYLLLEMHSHKPYLNSANSPR